MNTNLTTNLKWAIYTRKSTESEDRQVQSLENQFDYLMDVAKKEGYGVRVVFSESKSAKEPYVRTEFKKLIDLIEQGKIDGILCWKLDRLSRNPVDGGTIQHLLQKGKIQCIVASDRTYRPEDNAILFAVDIGQANQYSRDLAKNVTRGLQAKAAKGWYPNIPPVGYRNSKYRKKGEEKIIVDKARFSLVRKMIDLVLAGTHSPQAALRTATADWKLDMPKRGKRGRKPLGASSIYPILTNIFYTGKFYYASKLYQGKHQPMLTFEEFQKLQWMLKKKNHQRSSRHSFPFTGIMRCGNCGASITATKKFKPVKSTGQIESYIYYHCSRRVVGHTDCKEPPVSKKELETQIVELLEKLSIGEQYYKFGIQILKSTEEQSDKLREDVASKQLANIKTLEKKKEKLLSYLLNETITEETYRKEKAELEEQLELAKGQLNQIDIQLNRYSKQVENAFTFCHSTLDTFKNADILTQKDVLVGIGSNHKLIGKKLYVETFPWLSSIKAGEEKLQDQNDRFEPESVKYTKSPLKNLVNFSLLCGVIENVRKEMSKMTNPIIMNLPTQPENPPLN